MFSIAVQSDCVSVLVQQKFDVIPHSWRLLIRWNATRDFNYQPAWHFELKVAKCHRRFQTICHLVQFLKNTKLWLHKVYTSSSESKLRHERWNLAPMSSSSSFSSSSTWFYGGCQAIGAFSPSTWLERDALLLWKYWERNSLHLCNRIFTLLHKCRLFLLNSLYAIQEYWYQEVLILFCAGFFLFQILILIIIARIMLSYYIKWSIESRVSISLQRYYYVIYSTLP